MEQPTQTPQSGKHVLINILVFVFGTIALLLVLKVLLGM